MTSKVLIAGTGRAGTSFLVQLLTGYDRTLTGYADPSDGYRPDVRAGMERHLIPGTVTAEDAVAMPRVLKDPRFSVNLDALLRDRVISVDLCLVPFRPLREAAKSRVDAGLWWRCPDGSSVEVQERALAEVLGRLASTLHEWSIPHRWIRFERLVRDWRYALEVLDGVIVDPDPERFREVFEGIADPKR